MLIPLKPINNTLSTDNLPFMVVSFIVFSVIWVALIFLSNIFHNVPRVWLCKKALIVTFLSVVLTVILTFVPPMMLAVFPVQFLFWTLGIEFNMLEMKLTYISGPVMWIWSAIYTNYVFYNEMKHYIPTQGSSSIVNVLKICAFGIGLCLTCFIMVFVLVGFVMLTKDRTIGFIKLTAYELGLAILTLGLFQKKVYD
jgi:hypothetical protein